MLMNKYGECEVISSLEETIDGMELITSDLQMAVTKA
jgi:hypothetical protein